MKFLLSGRIGRDEKKLTRRAMYLAYILRCLFVYCVPIARVPRSGACSRQRIKNAAQGLA